MTTLVLKLKLQKKRDFNLQETLALTYTALQHSYSWLHKLYMFYEVLVKTTAACSPCFQEAEH